MEWAAQVSLHLDSTCAAIGTLLELSRVCRRHACVSRGDLSRWLCQSQTEGPEVIDPKEGLCFEGKRNTLFWNKYEWPKPRKTYSRVTSSFFFFSVPTEQTILEHSVTLRMGESHRQVKGVRGSSHQKEMIPTLSLEEGLDQKSTLVPTRPACVRSAVMLVSKGSGAAIIPTSQCLGWQMGLCLNSLVGGGEMHSKSGPLS